MNMSELPTCEGPDRLEHCLAEREDEVHPRQVDDPAEAPQREQRAHRVGAPPRERPPVLDGQRLGKDEGPVEPVETDAARGGEERQLEVDRPQVAADRRADREAKPEGGPHQPEALGPLLGRRDIGDVRIAGGEGAGGAERPTDGQQGAARRSLDQWVVVWENLLDLFAAADGINLDRKQVVLNAFFALEAAAR